MTPIASQPKIHIERMMHRSSLTVTGDTAASYALVKLIPAGGDAKPLPLNLAIVLDVSGSMYEEDGTGVSRLRRIQEAAVSALKRLQPHDNLAIIAFAHNAQVVLPPTPLSEKAAIEDVINRVDMFEVDPGGTAMDEGIRIGMAELEKHVGSGKLSQMIVLTDGETSGEQACRNWPRKPAKRRFALTSLASAPSGTRALSKTWPSWPRATGATSTSTMRPPPSASSRRSSPPWPRPASSTSKCTCASRRT